MSTSKKYAESNYNPVGEDKPPTKRSLRAEAKALKRAIAKEITLARMIKNNASLRERLESEIKARTNPYEGRY